MYLLHSWNNEKNITFRNVIAKILVADKNNSVSRERNFSRNFFRKSVALSGLVRKKKIPRAQGPTGEKEKKWGKKFQASAKCIVRILASRREYLSRDTSSESAIHWTRLFVQKRSVLYTEKSKLILHG